jgi:hypothetical protein
MNIHSLYIFVFILLVGIPQNASAYIDLGTGSYLLQVLAGVFLGGLYILKVYWKRLTLFFHPRKKDATETEPKAESERET